MSSIDNLILNSDTHELNKLVASGKFSIHGFIKENIKKPIQVEIFLNKSDIHNYGVFTKNYILANQTIESCHLIELEFRDKYHKDSTILNYSYAIKDNTNNSIEHGNKLFLMTGLGMMYNHSENNNAIWSIDTNNSIAVLTSNRYIAENEEITVNYGTGYWQRKNSEISSTKKILVKTV